VLVQERIEAAPPVLPGGRRERWALGALQVGAVAVVLVAVADRAHELDRFFVPKELVLHLAALVAALLALHVFRRVQLTAVDLLLAGFLLLSALSAAQAGDGALAARAALLSASGIAVFWAAYALREARLDRPLLAALALAAVLGSATALAQAQGITSDFFSVNRAPGGTLGNRNFVAHMAAFSLPVVLLVALRAWRTAGYLLGALGVPVVVAALVLTRSRAGWLAFGTVILVFALGMLLSRPLRRHGRTWRRIGGILLLGGAGVAAALLLPNQLRWVSENPYRESVTGIVNYQEGSGRGRVLQYRNSMRMAMDAPLLGVGPGNWPLEYRRYAAPGDPSLSQRNPRRTANPWPSSDWVAFVAERGLPAAAMLALALFGLAGSALRRLLAARDEEEGLLAMALLATVLATLVAGAFDAVLLLALPALLVWAALGALRSPPNPPAPERPAIARAAGVLLLLLALAAAAGAALSVRQLAEMEILASRPAPLPVLAGGGE
jgi:O-antigen ligase